MAVRSKVKCNVNNITLFLVNCGCYYFSAADAFVVVDYC